MADPGTPEFDCDSLEEYEIASSNQVPAESIKILMEIPTQSVNSLLATNLQAAMVEIKHLKEARVQDALAQCAAVEASMVEIGNLRQDIGRLQAGLKDAREFVAGMVTPAKYPTILTISSYHPCHALLDKIDAALGTHKVG